MEAPFYLCTMGPTIREDLRWEGSGAQEAICTFPLGRVRRRVKERGNKKPSDSHYFNVGGKPSPTDQKGDRETHSSTTKTSDGSELTYPHYHESASRRRSVVRSHANVGGRSEWEPRRDNAERHDARRHDAPTKRSEKPRCKPTNGSQHFSRNWG